MSRRNRTMRITAIDIQMSDPPNQKTPITATHENWMVAWAGSGGSVERVAVGSGSASRVSHSPESEISSLPDKQPVSSVVDGVSGGKLEVPKAMADSEWSTTGRAVQPGIWMG